MIKTYFSEIQLYELALIGVLHIVCVYYFAFKKNIPLALIWLFIAGLVARLVMISFDPYFHLWDEQYHALVAQNMAEQPFKPMLYKHPILDYDPNNWVGNHIWLHKQPLFLWQIALFIKLFGSSTFVVRLPSAIISSLLIPIIYRIGKLTISEQVGFIAAFIYATSYYLLDFNTGVFHTDHNDIAFIFYTTLSIWAYTEYAVLNNKNKIWLIGLFAGLAILNKWIVGLLVFSGWGVAVLFIVGWPNKVMEFKNILKALLVCILVVAPWQIYILITYPALSKFEYAYNSKHFFEPLEGHGGSLWYHFIQVPEQYGTIAAYILPFALIIFFIKMKNISAKVGYITFVVLTYLFFTLSKTKMPAFCLVIAPTMFLALGNFVSIIIDYINKIKGKNNLINFFIFIMVALIGFININIENIQKRHTEWVKTDNEAIIKHAQIKAKAMSRSIKYKYDPEKTIIINCGNGDNIPFMFFSGYAAYDYIPDRNVLEKLTNENYTIIYIDDFSTIPEYIKSNKNIIYISNKRKEKSIYLKAENGHYFCADKDSYSRVFANKLTKDSCTSFRLILLENNECIIRAYDNRILSAELKGLAEITATREKVGNWEVFKLIALGNKKVAFMATNGKFFSVDKNTSMLYANSNNIGKQEKFELIPK